MISIWYPGAAVDLAVSANLDGWFEFGESHSERGVDRPLMLMGAASHLEMPPLLGTVRTHPSDLGWAELSRASTGPRLGLAVPGGRHYTFTDAPAVRPRLRWPRQRRRGARPA
jgi:hypothetical protein